MSRKLKFVIIITLPMLLQACRTGNPGNVRVGSEYPPGNCQEIGQVIGNADTRKGAREQSMNNLKYQASQLEGNYVRLLAVAPYGTSARGIAYRCQ